MLEYMEDNPWLSNISPLQGRLLFINKYLFRNYEHIVKTHQNTPMHGQNLVSDEKKFQVVRIIFMKFSSLKKFKNILDENK